MGFGGALSNYNDNGTFKAIVNDLINNGGVYSCSTGILKTSITDQGVSSVTLPWQGSEYTITQELIGIRFYRLSDSAYFDIDNTPNWNNVSQTGSNTIYWNNVFPGVDYELEKTNAQVSHRIIYKPAFLDSMVTLYDQRPDSSDIYLTNIMKYTLSKNIDGYNVPLGNIRSRALKQLGSFLFSIDEQRAEFVGMDTLDIPEIPVWQRWEKIGGKIYMGEFVKVSQLKLIHINHPTTSIWHNASFVISDSSTAVESTRIYSFSSYAQYNYGASATESFGQTVLGVRYQRALYNFPTLRDSMDAVGSATWDSALFKVVATAVNGLNASDSIFSTVNKVTTIWDEGTGTGAATGGATWDSASATGTGGSEPNSPLDWTTNGGDYQSDGENQPTISSGPYHAIGDSVYFWNGGISQYDTVVYRISGTTVADTLDEGLILVAARQSASGSIVFASNDYVTPTVRRPKLIVYYTTAGGGGKIRGQVMPTIFID
jgi:hypothetical protein